MASVATLRGCSGSSRNAVRLPFGNSLRLRRNPHVSTNCGGGWKEPLSMVPQKHSDSVARSATLTIPELEQSEAAVLNTLASVHSRRSYAYAIEEFICLVLQRAQTNIQPYCYRAISVIPGKSSPVRRHDQPASFSDPEAGRRVRGKRLAESGTGDRHPASSGREAARTEEWQLAHA